TWWRPRPSSTCPSWAARAPSRNPGCPCTRSAASRPARLPASRAGAQQAAARPTIGPFPAGASPRYRRFDPYLSVAMAQYVYTMNRVGKIVPPKRQILRDISLSFFPGAKIGVLGLNGAGKSTLLRIMAGVDREIEGE